MALFSLSLTFDVALQSRGYIRVEGSKHVSNTENDFKQCRERIKVIAGADRTQRDTEHHTHKLFPLFSCDTDVR